MGPQHEQREALASEGLLSYLEILTEMDVSVQGDSCRNAHQAIETENFALCVKALVLSLRM